MRRVAIVGVGCTKVDEHWRVSMRDLFTEAALKALDGAGLDRVDALYVGNMFSDYAQNQGHLGAMMADSIGMPGIPAVKVEAACASGGVAVHEGFKAVASGLVDYVLVGGVEKMTDIQTPEVTTALMMAENREYTGFTGITFVGLNALISRLYMETYEAKPEEVAAISVNDHKHAATNPYAQYQFPITIETVMKSSYIADPLHLFECCGIGDGAASLVLCPLEKAQELSDSPVEIVASAAATQVHSLYERDDLLRFGATEAAAKEAYGRSGLKPDDIDVLEVHDAFSIVGVLAIEALGIAKRGEGARFVAEGNTALGGKIPTNTFGGLKARGHPIGGTGVYQIVELTWQLRGDAGKNQVPDARCGLAQNVGGVDSTSAVHILRRVGK